MPSNEGLDTEQTVVGQAHDRLEVRHEILRVTAKRFLDLCTQLQTLLRLRARDAGKGTHETGALALRLAQRRLRLAHELINVSRRFRH